MVEQLTPTEGLMMRARMYELLSLSLAYPTAEVRARTLDLAGALAPFMGLMHTDWADRVTALGAALRETGPDEVEAEFNRLFSGAMACAPYETAYEPDIFRKQQALADIAGFYRAFGFQVASGSRWQPDHLGVQLEYCSIVLQRTARALENGWQEQVGVCVDALRKFLSEHTGRWSAAVAGDLERAAQVEFYRHLALCVREWLELEMAALDVEPDRLRSRQVYAEDLEAPVCGGCTGCGPEGPPSPPGRCPT